MIILVSIKNFLRRGTSLAVQWLRLGAFTAKGPGPRFSPLVGELRSYKPCGVAKKKKRK